MESKTRLTTMEFDRLITHLAGNLSMMHPGPLVPIPRGGWPVAVALGAASRRSVLTVEEYMASVPSAMPILVDDIVDTGQTLARYRGLLGKPEAVAVSLYAREAVIPFAKPLVCALYAEPGEWIEFPWEGAEAPAEDGVTRMLQAIGEDPTRPGLLETPRRVLGALREMTTPLPFEFTTFDAEGDDQMIVVKDISLSSLCEHHLLPFVGKVSIGYVPDKRIAGLSKLARCAESCARGLQTQERLTARIATAMEDALQPQGVAVQMEAEHMCMTIRGVRSPSARTITTALRGVLFEDRARAEFLAAIR